MKTFDGAAVGGGMPPAEVDPAIATVQAEMAGAQDTLAAVRSDEQRPLGFVRFALLSVFGEVPVLATSDHFRGADERQMVRNFRYHGHNTNFIG